MDDELADAGGVGLASGGFHGGVYSATQPQVRARRRRFVDRIPQLVEVLTYTGQTAHEHAALLAHTAQLGQPRAAHDLILAAHARRTGRIILTADPSRFDGLEDVRTEPS